MRSAKARRIARPRPKMGKGYYRGKPGGPVVVPGFEWVSATVTGWASRQERRPVGARWAIEQELRFGKSELGVESVRVRAWEPRAKLLAVASLAYAFLVHLLGDGRPDLIPAILRWAHRTGRQARDAYRSLYRLRAALANLWNRHTPSFQWVP